MSASLKLHIYPVAGAAVWPYFAPHHYLTGKFNGHKAFVAALEDGTLVGFTSSIAFPHGSIKQGRREHRTVVLPDFQGLGIGARLSDWLAEWHVTQGHRFFSRTTHPRLGACRDASPYWRATSSNRKRATESSARNQNTKAAEAGGTSPAWKVDTVRLAYSHEYMGRTPAPPAVAPLAAPLPPHPPARTVHDLMIRPVFFAAVVAGTKTFEVRQRRGRDFAVGDDVQLIEWAGDAATGATDRRRITYVLAAEDAPAGLLPPDVVVLALATPAGN